MQRIQSFDLAKGFTVLLMPSIHVAMLYSKPEVQQSLLGDILGFIAEGPGAQLFMFLMGVSFTFSKKNSAKYVFQRAFYLLLAAYLLNFLKFIVPLGLGLLPDNLLAELELSNDLRATRFFFWIGDILHFAAIAYVLLFAIYQSRYYPFIALLLGIMIIFLSPYVWDQKFGIAGIDQVIVLFNGHPPQTFFPVFPWLVYPLMGLVLGYLLKDNNAAYIIRKAGIVGLGLIIISLILSATTSVPQWLPFYRTEPADTIFHLGFVLVWLAVFQWFSRKAKWSPLFTLLTFCSKQITIIYIIQWILICWCMVFTGYLQLDLYNTLAWMLAITTITLLIAHTLTRTHVHPKNI